MENFIIIKGLKMRRDAFFDPRGYKYINITPFHIPPRFTPQVLAPLDAAAIAAASSSCLTQKKITVPNRVQCVLFFHQHISKYFKLFRNFIY